MPSFSQALVLRVVEAFATAWLAAFVPLLSGIIYSPNFTVGRAALIAIGVAAFNAAFAAFKQLTNFSFLGVVRAPGRRV